MLKRDIDIVKKMVYITCIKTVRRLSINHGLGICFLYYMTQ